VTSPADAAIHINAVSPYAFRYDVTSTDPTNFDLSTVSSAVFRVLRENGNQVTWTAALTDQTTTTLRLTHVFAAGDVDQFETVTITPIMTAPAGDFFATPKRLLVRSEFD
jgi:hypothetical protein